MISNFNEVEKSLKRCLKEKVSITTATVVGFLIAGTVAFGGLIPEIPTGEEVITIDKKDTQYFKDPTFDTTNLKIVVNGEFITGGGAYTSSAFSVAKAGDTLTNKGYVWVTDGGKVGYAQAMGNNSGSSGTIVNKKIIYVDGTGLTAIDRIKGMCIDLGAAYNKGTIIVNGGSGMTDASGTSEKIIVNDTEGEITVEGVGVGIYHSKEALTEGSVENKGTINVTGKGIGVLLKNGTSSSSYDGKIFTNSGKIIANNGGTAIKTDAGYEGTADATIKLVEGSHIEGLIQLDGKNNTVDIDGVGTDNTSEENYIKSNDVNVKIDKSNIILKGTLNSKTNGTTVVVNNANGNTTLVNNAAISGNIGISLNGTHVSNKIEVTNTKDGSITVSKDGAVGVEVKGEFSTFTNNGIITLEKGTTNGIGISIDKGTATNNGTIVLESSNLAMKNVDGTAKNAGKIKITDKTSEELKDFDISTLFDGSYTNTGMIVDKFGIAIKQEGDAIITEDTDTSIINNAGKEGSSVVIEDGVTITASKDPIKVESLNVTGKVTIANGEESKPVVMEGTKTNLDANGSLAIGTSAGGEGGTAAELKITNGTVNAEAGKTAVTFEHTDSSLALSGTDFYGNIGNDASKGTLQTTGTEKATVITGDVKAKALELAGTTAITGNIETTSIAVTAGETKIDGTITGATEIKIGNISSAGYKLLKAPATVSGNVPENATVTYSADSAIIGKGTPSEAPATYENEEVGGKTTVTIGDNGVVKAEVGNEGNYVFSNSENVDVKGNGTVELLTSNLNKQTLKLKEGTNVAIGNNLKFITNSNFYLYDAASETLTYKLDNVNNKILSDISNKSFVVNSVLSKDPNAREAQFDSIYSNGVYSETVKMAMDTLRMNEDAVLSLSGKPEEGKWTAQGKMLFSRTEYDRTGVIRDFGVETKTAGLLGALEYGVSEKSSIGFAFSGSKQDLDMKKASADGDAFYFGVYGKQDVNNFKLTAGLGYQLDKIDADNNVMVSTGDKYDSKAFSGYAQGKYVINAGNDVTVEPKLKLALTRLTQESAKDKHFEMEKVEATTFDTEVGVDLVKTVKLESGKMNLLAGISYTRSMGDTDNKFKGNFVGTDGTKGERFDVLGANLGENTLKINIGAEVEKDNGFFYNGGLNYKFDNEDRETFGATIGAGYKF
ncbi:MAG: autotransporter domain-containing protein [Fusobacterium ulcerans]|uniref:autotransporter family protein n=1 Tax=Fusobacterium ulcerans TaxID=861 RepID=UPI003A89D33B